MASSSDLENPNAIASLPYSYVPLPDREHPNVDESTTVLHPKKAAVFLVCAFLSIAFLVTLMAGNGHVDTKNLNANVAPSTVEMPKKTIPMSRGVDQGVSEKSFRPFLGADNSYPWNSNMLGWQRPAFHFRPEKNWMNGKFFTCSEL